MRFSPINLKPIPAEAKRPTGSQWYLSCYHAPVGEYVVYHDLNNAARTLQKADVLFLGNSRVMFALGQEELQPFFKRLGLSYYVMAFPNPEQNRFSEAIIRKYDLRPKWVIVNVDSFFLNQLSPFAKKVTSESWWNAWKFKFEMDLAFGARSWLHQVVPYYDVYRPGGAEWITFGSYRDGTNHAAVPKRPPRGLKNIPDEPGSAADSQMQATAMRFKEEMERRGARVVFTAIPPRSPKEARELGAALGVPVVVADVARLRSFDGSHLDRASATRYAKAFLAELEKVLAGQDRSEARVAE
jgi:hypothetical protein